MVSAVNLRNNTLVPDPGFAYTIVRSQRRSMSIEVRRAEVVIRSPLGVDQSVLLDFLQHKAQWVKRKIAEQQATIEAVPVRTYVAGSVLPYMDTQLSLVIGRGNSAAINRVDDKLHLILSSRSSQSDEQQIKRLLQRWYQQQALRILSGKTGHLSQAMGLTCGPVTIKATRSKWGHCTSLGAIQYNWQILLAPEAIVDYLVAHEVSHLRHHNHSREFWLLVASVCPDFKMHRAWLKANGVHLIL